MPDRPDTADVLDTPQAGALVVRGGALRVGGFAAGTLLSLVGVIALTRHLGVVDYGRYQAVIALVAIVSAIGDLGLGTLALREHAQADVQERARGLEALLGLRTALAIAGVAVSAGLAAALGYDATMVAGAALSALAGILAAAQQTATVPLQTVVACLTPTNFSNSASNLDTNSPLDEIQVESKQLATYSFSLPVR